VGLKPHLPVSIGGSYDAGGSSLPEFLHALSILSHRQRSGDRFPIGGRRRFDPAAAGMPGLPPTVHDLRTRGAAVVKKGGVRDPFDRDKIKRGLAKACWKRPMTEDDIEVVVSSLEGELYGSYESDVPSRVIGERLMELLKDIDHVAYVRFASVYREFKDVRDFVDELEPILNEANRLES
jgi:transcriptional regulator NrdR